ncbi:Importin-beta N-terminal domain containing protein [Trichomonas vaginalis G3]|uniref:Importin-beta N-terminal domain containing protein n=1 Tax=Trichomonas vaginalis (strain ATCC PRA-98 / G3) TaxID=412133 RepID=A2EE18_TRIV3|nr:armadillo (ARM) repeat-containing protein family [Trichomonas vaginalis G3]EAY09130.1 Importin-beta N-terminal domain containing protein [Trichomonas vaginalis G3]KAI5502638.1 armadillo (ARM) repeat-containing protein family [Trichomonas vaginalis G3]|eukprot:XP_001321353.1 Importin-beta N-terminal domain containing protein [Trichomonas vaginalis G3]
MDDSIYNQVLDCFRRMRGNNGNEIESSSLWLSEFCSNPNSINTLVSIIQNNTEEVMRQYAVITLKTALHTNWFNISESEQDQIFQLIIQLILSQQSMYVKVNLVDVFQRYINPNHIMNILPIIFEQTNSEDLNIALCLTQLIATEKNFQTIPEVENVLQNLFQRGFSDKSTNTRLETFYCMYRCARSGLISQIADLWDNILELLDICIQDEQKLSQFINIMDEIMDDLPGLCDPISLYERCIIHFDSQDKDPTILQHLYVIINALGANFLNSFEGEEFYIQFIQITYDLMMYFYEPSDELSVSLVQKYEIGMSEVISTVDFLKYLWQMSLDIVGTDKGKFCFLTALYATHERSPEFYEDKTHDITEFFASCIDTEIPTILEKCAMTITEFKPTLKQNADLDTQQLAIKLMPVVQNNPTEIYISALTALVSALQDTSLIFSDVFSIAHNLLLTNNPTLALNAIPLLASAIARGFDKVEEFFPNIEEFISTYLNSTEESDDTLLFKIEAIRCIEQLILTFNNVVISQCGHLIEYLVSSIASPLSSSFELACMSALSVASENAPQILPQWSEEALNYLISIVNIDLDAQFKENLEKPINENSDDEIFKTKYQKHAFILNILSHALLSSEEIYNQHIDDLIAASTMMRRSFSPECQAMACVAIKLISEAALKYNSQSQELTEKLFSIAIGDEYEDKEVQTACANAIRAMIFVHKAPCQTEMLVQILSHFYKYVIFTEDIFGCDEFVLLAKDVIYTLAKQDFANIKSFAEQLLNVNGESKSHFYVALCIISFLISAEPSQFDNNFKQQILNLQNERISNLETISSSMFIREISVSDPAFFQPLAQQSFEALLNAITSPLVDSVVGRKIMHYATVSAMHLVLNVIPEILNVEIADAILTVLPLKCDTGDSMLQASFIISVYKRTEGQFNMKIAEIIRDCIGDKKSLVKNDLTPEIIQSLKDIYNEIEASGILGE